jgi:ribosomal protein L24
MQQQAGRIQMPGKVHVSNVMLVCGTCGKTTRPKFEIDDAGAKRRVCRGCGAAIARTGGEE